MFIEHREQCQMYNIYGLRVRASKINFTTLLLGPGDRLRLLSKLRI
jgi:hypothetical protein